MDEASVTKIVAAILANGMLANGEVKGETEAVRAYQNLHRRLRGETQENETSEAGEFHTPWR